LEAKTRQSMNFYIPVKDAEEPSDVDGIITVQAILACFITIIGIIDVAGTFKEIDATAELRDNCLLASGFDNGNVYVWSPNENTSPLRLFTSSSPCTALLFNKKSSILYAAQAGNIASWDLRKVDGPADTWQVSEDELNSMDILEAEKLLAVADDMGSVHLLSTDSGDVLRLLEKHENICSAVRFRPNHINQLVSAGLDCQLFVSDWKENGHTLSVFRMADLVDPAAYTNLLQSEEDEYGSSHNSDELKSDSESDYSDASVGSQVLPDGNEPAKHSTFAPLRLASSLGPLEKQELVTARIAGTGLPLNLPMIHSLACSRNGEHVVAGLESGTVEIFNGGDSHLSHAETLCGHKRGVAAVLCLEDTHVISGGNDCQLFLWELSSGRSGHQFAHSGKVCALAGRSLSAVYVADSSPNIQVGSHHFPTNSPLVFLSELPRGIVLHNNFPTICYWLFQVSYQYITCTDHLGNPKELPLDGLFRRRSSCTTLSERKFNFYRLLRYFISPPPRLVSVFKPQDNAVWKHRTAPTGSNGWNVSVLERASDPGEVTPTSVLFFYAYYHHHSIEV
uniref:WD_REPEATS_REGION domain-containing protein n=1 Tax=Schistocephalus solidus TaxID=70667 RepID=A0A183SKL2_SCHSO